VHDTDCPIRRTSHPATNALPTGDFNVTEYIMTRQLRKNHTRRGTKPLDRVITTHSRIPPRIGPTRRFTAFVLPTFRRNCLADFRLFTNLRIMMTLQKKGPARSRSLIIDPSRASVNWTSYYKERTGPNGRPPRGTASGRAKRAHYAIKSSTWRHPLS